MNNQQDLSAFVETKEREESPDDGLDPSQGVQERSPAGKSGNVTWGKQQTPPLKSLDEHPEPKPNDEYVDEFLGSYNDLGIVEDDAPGTDSYRDDEYEMMEEEIEGQ